MGGSRGGSRSRDRDGNDRSRSRGGRKDSRSRSRRSDSRGGADEGQDRRRKPDDYGVDTIKITDDDAAFILGKGGKTKEKIARVAEAEIELFERDLILEFRGSKLQRRKAKKYAEGVMAQRTGPVVVNEDYDDGDLTMLMVPQEAVGFVTGRAGNFLRSIEEQWGTLMFFCEVDGSSGRRNKTYEKLAIFGSVRGRRGAELLVLSAVETKVPGYFQGIREEVLERDRGRDETGTWGTDTTTFQDDELSYALGKQGGTRKKLERSSGAVVQYVGQVALFSGPKAARKRAKEYMKWLFEQLEGPVYVERWEDRDDVTVLDIPGDCVGYVTGSRRAALGGMEEEWGTLMFFMTKPGEKGKGRNGEQLAIFGDKRARRGAELKVMSSVEEKSPGYFTRSVREKISDEKGFGTDRIIFKDDELSYALGKQGTTRKKLALASGCILQYVGHVAFMAGTMKERRRCKEFIEWLLQQRRGQVTVNDIAKRDDCTEVHVPENCKGWVTGNRGSELRRVEQETGTYMFMALDRRGDERLLIFSVNPGTKASDGGRMHAERLINEMIQDKLRGDGDRGRSDSRGRSPPPRQRSDSRRRGRSRSPPRRRSPSPQRRGRSDSRRR